MRCRFKRPALFFSSIAHLCCSCVACADRTGFWGKYLNTYGSDGAGRGLAVPPGWTEWGGLVGNSRYYNYNMSRNGVVEQHHSDYGLDYFTDLISRDANAWIERITDIGSANHSHPFLAVLSTPACHDGTIPAPQYDNVALLNGTLRAPRTGNWDLTKCKSDSCGDKHHFGSAAAHPPMTDGEVQFSDLHYLRRLLTLQSVDDLVESLVTTLRKSNVLDDTCVVYTSDNGYHHGQFSQVLDKRNP